MQTQLVLLSWKLLVELQTVQTAGELQKLQPVIRELQ